MSRPLVVERSRGLIRVTGRDPVRMIQGLATADIEAVTPEQGVYTTFLTPKGRMVADARIFRAPASASGGSASGGDETAGDDTAGDDAGLLLDTTPDALPGLLAHLRKFVPPLFAKGEDVSGAWAVVGVYGEGADDVLSAASDSGGQDGHDGKDGYDGTARPADGPADGTALPAGAVVREEAVVAFRGGFRVRTFLTGDPGWDIFVGIDGRDAVVEALLEAGGRAGDPESLEALRIAAGRPRWGRELTEDVIPLEAGLLDRAISQSKGCYTGQEVIVRILHRGHVNRHLRRLEFVGAVPEPGTELFEPGNEKPRGWVTSAVENDDGALGLGYVRREIEPPADLHVGSPGGDPVRVTALD